MITRRFRSAIVPVLVLPVLAACSQFDVPTDQVYIRARGVNDRSSEVDVLQALVVASEDGSGTVVATLVNNSLEESDELTAVEVGGAPAEIDTQADVTELPTNAVVNLGPTGAVTATSDAIKRGSFVEVTFSFRSADSVTLSVPVVPNTDEFADIPVPQDEDDVEGN